MKRNYKFRLTILVIAIFFLFRMLSLNFFELRSYNASPSDNLFLNVNAYIQQIVALQQDQRNSERNFKRILSIVYFLFGFLHIKLHDYLLLGSLGIYLLLIDFRKILLRLLTMSIHGSRYKNTLLII